MFYSDGESRLTKPTRCTHGREKLIHNTRVICTCKVYATLNIINYTVLSWYADSLYNHYVPIPISQTLLLLVSHTISTPFRFHPIIQSYHLLSRTFRPYHQKENKNTTRNEENKFLRVFEAQNKRLRQAKRKRGLSMSSINPSIRPIHYNQGKQRYGDRNAEGTYMQTHEKKNLILQLRRSTCLRSN